MKPSRHQLRNLLGKRPKTLPYSEGIQAGNFMLNQLKILIGRLIRTSRSFGILHSEKHLKKILDNLGY
jgi:hypothetical protein